MVCKTPGRVRSNAALVITSINQNHMHTYIGSCHCGAVKYQIEADISGLYACNCSHCAKKSFLLTFVPKTQFTLISGADNLTEYRFNKKAIAHLFCKTCGVQCFAYGSDQNGAETASVNVHTLDGFDPSTIPVTHFNGKDL